MYIFLENMNTVHVEVGGGGSRQCLKYDVTCAETRFRLSRETDRVHLNRSGGVSSVDYWQPRFCASAVLMLDTPCSEVVWRVLAAHYIRQFPLHFPTRGSPCAITFQQDSIHRFYLLYIGRGQLKYDVTRAENRFRPSREKDESI